MNLFVGSLSQETTEEDLRTIFSEFGEIVALRILRDKETGFSRGFGFVEMADRFCAFDAIDNIDQTFLHGQVISVKEAKSEAKTGKPNKGKPPFKRKF
jgi:RNA recognition motif-containing protein